MPLSPGDKLGPYEILSLLGKGGMGEVYRAHDGRLRRDVAIKVSNAQFTERFTREARTVASLNHTNIAHLYDVGPNYLVMELVEGEDLKGPLPFDDALPIIQQLIDGIEAAHEKYIIHRDLKPANIKITPEGVVKILDFGLAKAMEPPPHDDDPGNSPTLTMGATVAGTILGTAAYMAPEQAKGKAADKRSDIWSFGVVVYEMLTGKRLFQGESVVEILGGVLNKEADFSAAPARVHKMLGWCLEKDRKHRLASISDARRMLNDSAAPEPATIVQKEPPSKLPWLAAGALALALIGLGAWTYTRPTAAAATTRLSITTPENRPVVFPGYPNRSLAISPDGAQLVYVGSNLDARQVQLQLRSLASLEVRELPGTTNARQPFFSPDGQWVAFFTPTGELKKISLAGGSPITLVEKMNASTWAFGVWSEDNTIIFGNSTSGLRRVSAEGGAVTDLTTLKPGEPGHSYPVLTPSGRAVLFDNYRAEGTPIEAVMLDSGQRTVVIENAAFPFVLRSGHLVFQRDGNILIAPFDATKLVVTGPAVPLIDKVRQNTAGPIPVPEMAVSGNVSLAYAPAADTAGALGLVSRDGAFQPLGLPPSNFGRPRVSPDGRSIAYIVGSGQKNQAHVYDLQRGSTTKLTQDDSQDQGIVWRPDSHSLGIYSRRKDANGIFLRSPDGGERLLVPIPKGVTSLRNFSWAPDGKQLAYTAQTGSQHDIWIMALDDKNPGDKPTSQPFLKSAAAEYSPKFSPDGRWLAYVSDESGRPEVYVHGYPQGEQFPVSTNGGNGPVWRRDGKELYFQGSVDGVPKMMAVAVTPDGASLHLAKPVPLFDLRATGPNGVIEQYAGSENSGAGYDVLPDGRFVMVRGPDRTSTREIVVVQNWFEELKRLAPGK